jgi:hypothetical protein
VVRPEAHLTLAPAPDEHGASTAQAVGPLPVELPRERRPTWSTLAVLAAACGLGAVVLGLGAVLWPGDDSSPSPSSSPALEQAVSILADPAVERITFAGSVGRLVLLVGQRGDAVLALNGLGPAPEGRVYQAWVTQPGPGETLPAGLLGGTDRFVALTQRVAPGAQVSVTLEDDAGAAAPTKAPRLYAVRPLAESGS